MALRLVEVHTLPNYKGFNYARIGSFSLSTYDNRYVEEKDVYEFNGERNTVPGHYRNFIDGVQFYRKNAPAYPLSYPYYAQPIVLPSAVYLDLRCAFQQIALSFGYEVWYKEGKAISYGQTIPDSPMFKQIKVSRGLLVTAHGEKARFTEWKNKKLSAISFPNNYHAPYLRYAIWRTLHSLMNAVKPYIFYCHTDGVIMNSAFLSRVEKIWSRYHVNYAIKSAGHALVYGVGSYQVGELATINRSHGGAKDFIISDEYDSWWLDKFVQGYERRSKHLDDL